MRFQVDSKFVGEGNLPYEAKRDAARKVNLMDLDRCKKYYFLLFNLRFLAELLIMFSRAGLGPSRGSDRDRSCAISRFQR